jgi:hypothetical protein
MWAVIVLAGSTYADLFQELSGQGIFVKFPGPGGGEVGGNFAKASRREVE